MHGGAAPFVWWMYGETKPTVGKALDGWWKVRWLHGTVQNHPEARALDHA